MSSPPRAYFAYSPLIDPAVFEDWRQKHGYGAFRLPEGEAAEALEVDLAFDFVSPRWGGRIASLVKKPGKTVHGKLFRISASDWAIIQHAEGARGGKFVELPIQVRAGGKTLTATAFSAHPDLATHKGPVSEDYARALAQAAEAAKLPHPWVLRLKAESEILQRVQAFGRQQGLSKD